MLANTSQTGMGTRKDTVAQRTKGRIIQSPTHKNKHVYLHGLSRVLTSASKQVNPSLVARYVDVEGPACDMSNSANAWKCSSIIISIVHLSWTAKIVAKMQQKALLQWQRLLHAATYDNERNPDVAQRQKINRSRGSRLYQYHSPRSVRMHLDVTNNLE